MADPSIDENIRVYIRRRPLLPSDADEGCGDAATSAGAISSSIKTFTETGNCAYYAATSKIDHTFKFDGCFDSGSAQLTIYEKTAKPIVDSALLGYSGTIFAYGPTNSGKTFTMRGMPGSEDKGIMPRCIEQLLQAVRTGSGELWVSYLQIYCEVVSDLLNPTGTSYSTEAGSRQQQDVQGPPGEALQLSIREKGGRVFVEGLSRAPITNMQDLVNILARGDANRATAETNMNATSSRSHAALMVSIMIPEGKKTPQGPQSYRESSLVLVDLAGSERATASTGRQHMRLEEAKAINLSLSALGNCMSALAECRKHIPYRDSKLTRLLQGSLGGGARTAVIVAIPPGSDEMGEILNALRFASRASKVKVVAKVSRFVDYEALYNDSLQRLDDIEAMKQAWQMKKGGTEELLARHEEELEALREENAMLKKQLAYYTAAGVEGRASSASSSSSSSASSSNSSSSSSRESQRERGSDKAELKHLTDRHIQDMNDLKTKYERKLTVFRNQLADAGQETATLQTDLAAERERHLATVKDLRRVHQKVDTVEASLGLRIEELLAEVDDKDGKLEDLIDMVRAQTARADEVEGRLLEARSSAETMVSKSKVTEMENLFVETVNRLSSRVMQLEQRGQDEDEGPAEGGKEASAGQGKAQFGLPPAPNALRIQPGGRVLQQAKAPGKFAR